MREHSASSALPATTTQSSPIAAAAAMNAQEGGDADGAHAGREVLHLGADTAEDAGGWGDWAGEWVGIWVCDRAFASCHGLRPIG